jgi:hypothetical protein
MNPRCSIAFRSPCARADATLAPKFWRRLFVDGLWLSSIVTVNK